MRGRTTIIITHNLAAVRDATAILVLEDGRVVERGGRAKLAAANGAFARLSGQQDAPMEFMPLETSAPIRNGRDRRGLRWPGSLLVPVA